MPDRILGSQPSRRAGYIVIFLAFAVVVLGVWNVSLGRRLNEQDSLRRLEERAAAARKVSECRARIAGTKQANDLLAALRDLAVIPQTNIQSYLDGPLTADQRASYVDALARYRAAEKRLGPFPIPSCVRSDP